MTSFRIFFFIFFLFILFIGPWPTDETPFKETQYAQKTRDNINQLSPIKNVSALKAGTATIEIKPLPHSSLAGYSARDPKNNTGALDKIYAKAITLSNNQKSITILTAEILLPLPELVNAIVKKTGLNRNEIYFTVTHTHSGPGSYAHGIIESTSMGSFSQAQFDLLVDTLSATVQKSRINLQPVTLKYTRLAITPDFAQQFILNQLNTKTDAHSTIHALELFKTNTSEKNHHLATLITFSAHPTFLGRLNHKVSGDYPNLLMRELESKIGGVVLFSVGAVGGMLPVGNGSKPVKNLANEKKQLAQMGKSIADFIAKGLKQKSSNASINLSSWQSSSPVLQSEIVPIELPFPNYRITDNLRLSPFVVNLFLHNNTTYIHTLKIGKLFLLSYPADYSGELAASLENWADAQGVYPWATSFNGEYIGYLSPSKYYNRHHYTTRGVNFYGKWAGDYFLETSKHIITTLK